MAPTIRPPATMGTPPSSGVAPSKARRRRPAPPAAITSSSALVGRRYSSAVRALPSAIRIEAICVPSSRCIITRWPPLSTMAIATPQPLRLASSSAAAMARPAASNPIGAP